ncbi:LysR family transcriptional regulator [Brucellaceae bacterium C25G]
MKYGIEFRHLTYFTCVAKELHFSRAADLLGMAQAPLSQQIQQLEDRLGVKLFQRTTRRVKLTPAGETFLEHAEGLLGGLDKAVSATRSLSDEVIGTIVISGVHIALSHAMPPVIAAFKAKYPRVKVDVVTNGTGDQLELLRRGDVHVAFIRPINPVASIKTAHLATEGLVAVLPVHHRLTSFDEVSIKDFSGEALITYGPTMGASYNRAVTAAFRRAKIYPSVQQEVSHSLAVSTLVGAQQGIGIAPSWVQYNVSPYVTCRPIKELKSAVDLVVAWRSDRSQKIVLEFVKTAREVVPTISW